MGRRTWGSPTAFWKLASACSMVHASACTALTRVSADLEAHAAMYTAASCSTSWKISVSSTLYREARGPHIHRTERNSQAGLTEPSAAFRLSSCVGAFLCFRL